MLSRKGSGKIKALLAISLVLFVIGFVVVKSGAIEKHTVAIKAKGKTPAKTSTSYRFNASKISAYLKKVTSPITGSKALEVGNDK